MKIRQTLGKLTFNNADTTHSKFKLIRQWESHAAAPLDDKSMEFAPPSFPIGNTLTVFGKQVVDVSDKESAKQASAYGYKSWKDLVYDFFSHFVSGVFGALGMMFWLNRRNKKKH